MARCVLFVLVLLITQTAGAVASSCTYMVSKVTLYPSGGVLYATFSQVGGAGKLDYAEICSMDITLGSPAMSPATCKTMLAMLLTAKTTATPVVLWFNQPTAFDCTTVTSPFQFLPSGWYFGPSLE